MIFVTGAGSGTSAPLLVTLPGGVFTGSDSTAVTKHAVFTALSLSVTGNGPGSFTGAALVGAMPLRGHLLFKGKVTVTTLIDVPLSIHLRLPGIRRRRHGHGAGAEGLQRVLLSPAHGVARGSRRRDRAAVRLLLPQVTLVSPTKVRHQFGSPGPGGGFGTLVVLGKLTLNFVPEPGTLVLLCAGAIGLGLVGRARRKRS